MMKLFVLFSSAIFIFACASTQPTLTSYQTKSLDEEKIVNLVFEFQKAYSTQNMEKILATYAKGAMIKTNMTFENTKKDWSGIMIPKEEHAAILAKQMNFYRRVGINLEVERPKTIYIKENEASMVAPYELYATNPYRVYVEKGILNFQFKKTNSTWLISERTWEILDCNHPDFKDWQKKQQ